MLKKKTNKFIKDFPLGRMTRFGVGGAARRFSVAHSENTLISEINYAKQHAEPYLIIGKGTNLVVSDQGVKANVIQNKVKGITRQGRTLTVGAGVNLNFLVSYCCCRGLAGIEKMAGIPGSVGGAVVGNAGAYGQEIKDCVVCVKIYDGYKTLWLATSACKFAYRESIFKKRRLWSVLAVKLRFQSKNPEKLKSVATQIRRIRKLKYPSSLRCAGSYFKNINLSDQSSLIRKKLIKQFADKIKGDKLPTGALVEKGGLCGKRIGQIKIADYHGNLIINLAGGKSRDLFKLVKLVKSRILKNFGVKLEEEVQII